MEMEKFYMRALGMLQGYICAAQIAENRREMEVDATIWIQSCWRRYAAQKMIDMWTKAANDIKRLWRGHKGRERAHARKREVDKEKRKIYFHVHALTIQRHYRGYYSRKFKHDYYRRQRFIKDSVMEGSHINEDCVAFYRKQRTEEEDAAIERSKKAVEYYWHYNHPRLSTETAKGVYKAPYIWLFGPKGQNYFEDNLRRARIEKSKEETRWRSMHPVKKEIPVNKHLRYDQVHGFCFDRFITRRGRFISLRDVRMQQERRDNLEQVNENIFYPRVHDRELVYGPTVRCDREYGYEENLKKVERKLKKERWRFFHKDRFALELPSGFPFSITMDEEPQPTWRRESQLT